MKRWQIILLVIFVIATIGGAGYLGFSGTDLFSQNETHEPIKAPPTVAVSRGDVKQTIISPGKLVNYNTRDLISTDIGSVEGIYVHAGDVVQEGDLLVQLGGEDLLKSIETSKIQAMEAISNYTIQLRDAQYELDRYFVPKTFREEVPAEVVKEKKAAYDQALLDFEPFRYLESKNLTRKKYDNLLIVAQNDYTRATRWFELLTLVEIVQTNLEQAQQDLEIVESHQEKLTMTAPFDGVILDVSVYEGERVTDGTRLLQIAESNALEVLASVIEEDYPLLTTGLSVELYFDAAPDSEASGKLTRIIPKRVSSDRPLYQVYISVDEIPYGVVDGMTADAEIILAQKTNVLVLPRALVQALSDGTANVSIWVNDHIEEREITIGLRGDVFVEILSGLEEGEQVVGK